MGNLRACLIVAISALAGACGDDGGSAVADASVDSAPDAKLFMDAPPPMFDFTCVNTAAPTTAPADIDLSGTAQIADGNPISGFAVDPIDMAQINVCTTGACNGSPPSDDSDAAGDWAVTAVPTSSAPLNAYLELTKTGVRTTYVYPGVPFTADQAGIPVLVFGAGLLGILEQALGCDPATPIMAVAVSDCANMPITDTANVSIVVKQGGTPVATAEATDLSSFPGAPPQVAGLWLVCGVPANAATNIGATYNGMTLLAHDVKTVNGTTTTTLVRPGY